LPLFYKQHNTLQKHLIGKQKMSFKKVLILPVGFILINAVYTACICNCPEVKALYYNVLNVAVKPVGSGGTIIDNGVPTNVDTLLLSCSFDLNCTVKHTNNLSFLVNSAYACSCAGCGDKGLKNNLISFLVTSSEVYNGVAAGQPLNSIFSVKPNYNSTSSYPLDTLIKTIKTDRYIAFNYSLFTKTKPANNNPHKFTIALKFADSSFITSTTSNAVIWQ
jgi:hypothetical protein